jgi:hypothetical protein
MTNNYFTILNYEIVVQKQNTYQKICLQFKELLAYKCKT